MDPNATAELLRQALEDGDTEAAQEYGRALDEWAAKGGFAPDNDPRHS